MYNHDEVLFVHFGRKDLHKTQNANKEGIKQILKAVFSVFIVGTLGVYHHYQQKHSDLSYWFVAHGKMKSKKFSTIALDKAEETDPILILLVL